MKPPRKIEVPLTKFNRLINTGPTVLVSCHDGEKPNVMTVAWSMPCARKPPTVALAIGSGSYTHEVVRRTRELVVNIPSRSLIEAVVGAGTTSGREADKFAALNLTPRQAKTVGAPWIAECMGHLECVLAEDCEGLIERTNLFLCEVKAAWAEERAFREGRWAAEGGRAPTLHHLGGPHFFVPGEVLEQA